MARFSKRSSKRAGRRRASRKRATTFALARPIRPKTHVFKRTVVEILDLGVHNTSNPYVGYNNIYSELTSGSSNTSWTIAPYYQLGDLTASGDFVNLFTHYKICGVNERYFLSNNPATAPPVIAAGEPGGTINIGGTSGVTNYYNPSILMDSWYNPAPVTGPALANDVYQIQRRTRRVLNVMGKKMYSKVKQLVMVEDSAATADVNILANSNRWIPMENTNIAHYGMTHWIRASTGTGQMPGISVRIERTYYIACKGVR